MKYLLARPLLVVRNDAPLRRMAATNYIECNARLQDSLESQ